ncbi:MAG: 50S ribosomal protein L28 [Aureispira sp.]|nr:50S ribosomal protein L28 [Aureispira sp.]
MSRVCQITGKRPMKGNNVSHSNHRTKRRFLPNLHKKRVFVAEANTWVTLKLTSKALRNIDKLGAYNYLKAQIEKGFDPFVWVDSEKIAKKVAASNAGYRLVKETKNGHEQQYVTYAPEFQNNKKIKLSRAIGLIK